MITLLCICFIFALLGGIFKITGWMLHAAFSVAGTILALVLVCAVIGIALRILGFLGIIGAIVLICMAIGGGIKKAM